MSPPNFIARYWCVQKLWRFYEKWPYFKLTKLEKALIDAQIPFWILWWPWKGRFSYDCRECWILWKSVLKVSAIRSDTRLQSLSERKVFIGSCRTSFQIASRTIFSSIIFVGFWCTGLIFLKPSPPDMKVKRVKIRWIGWIAQYSRDNFRRCDKANIHVL